MTVINLNGSQKRLKDKSKMWKEYFLEEVCTKITDGSHFSPKSVEDGLRMASVKDLTTHGINLESCRLISKDDFQKLVKLGCQPEVGDVLIAKDGNSALDTVCLVKHHLDVVLLSSVAILRPNPHKINSSYLYYYLDSSTTRKYLKSGFITGAAIPRVVLKDFKRCIIPIPPLPTQKKIASILSAYDDLIENNTRRIKILEEMAQMLYREWFVNFRFPNHENVKMVESELGLIPEGWEVKKLGELGLLARGKSKHRPRNDPSLYGGDFPFIQTGEVKESSLYIMNHTQTYNNKGLSQSRLWEAGTLLITIAANIAETAIITFSACFPDSIVGFIPSYKSLSSEFIKYSIDVVKLRMQNVSKGTTQDNLSLEKIKIFHFLVPDENITKLFNTIANPLFLQAKNLQLKNINLRKTRDLLLPKLISGEIDVENLDIETVAAAA